MLTKLIYLTLFLLNLYLANVDKIIFDLPISTDRSAEISSEIELIKFDSIVNSHKLKISQVPKDYLISIDNEIKKGRYEIRLVSIASSPVDSEFREICTKKESNDATGADNCYIVLSVNQNNYVKNPTTTTQHKIDIELVLDPMVNIYGIQTDIPSTALPSVWLIICSLPVALIGFLPFLRRIIKDDEN